jgi:antitoxin component YwqK of YwqJK toxin-antitoxin module
MRSRSIGLFAGLLSLAGLGCAPAAGPAAPVAPPGDRAPSPPAPAPAAPTLAAPLTPEVPLLDVPPGESPGDFFPEDKAGGFYIYALAAGPGGELWLAGRAQHRHAAHESRLLIGRKAASGAIRWLAHINTTAEILAIAPAPDGDLIVSGRFTDALRWGGVTLAGGSSNPFVLKLSGADGAVRWARAASVWPVGSGLRSPYLAVDAAGDIFLADHCAGAYDWDGRSAVAALTRCDTSWAWYLTKLSGKDGAPIFSRELSLGRRTGVHGLASDAAGGVYLFTYAALKPPVALESASTKRELIESEGAGVYALAKLGADGEPLWRTEVTGTYYGLADGTTLTQLAVAPDGSAAVRLYFIGALAGDGYEYGDLEGDVEDGAAAVLIFSPEGKARGLFPSWVSDPPTLAALPGGGFAAVGEAPLPLAPSGGWLVPPKERRPPPCTRGQPRGLFIAELTKRAPRPARLISYCSEEDGLRVWATATSPKGALFAAGRRDEYLEDQSSPHGYVYAGGAFLLDLSGPPGVVASRGLFRAVDVDWWGALPGGVDPESAPKELLCPAGTTPGTLPRSAPGELAGGWEPAKGCLRDAVPHGPALTMSPISKRMTSYGEYRDGKRVGPWKFWRDTGELHRTATYVDGEEEGPVAEYGEDSIRENDYRGGKWTGFNVTYTSRGKRLRARVPRDGGGYWERSYIDGELSAEAAWASTPAYGSPEFLSRPPGTGSTATYRDGPARFFYASGQTRCETRYERDRQVGPHTCYHPNGQKALERVYEGVFAGRERQWDRRGELLGELSYDAKGVPSVASGKPVLYPP